MIRAKMIVRVNSKVECYSPVMAAYAGAMGIVDRIDSDIEHPVFVRFTESKARPMKVARFSFEELEEVPDGAAK